MSVQCWPEGTSTRCPCENEIPDVEFDTMRRFGWGFRFAPDAGSPTGEGAFYACPEHRDDCTEEERAVARAMYANASALQGPAPVDVRLAGEVRRVNEPIPPQTTGEGNPPDPHGEKP